VGESQVKLENSLSLEAVKSLLAAVFKSRC